MIPFSTYAVESHPFAPGSRLLVYTDGLTEVFRGEEEFGGERLLDSFRGCDLVESEAVLDFIWATLDKFSDGQEQSDDMTALVLLRQSDPPARREART
jgi:serine phosphatase RsbU (regulator of sigma subunit)